MVSTCKQFRAVALAQDEDAGFCQRCGRTYKGSKETPGRRAYILKEKGRQAAAVGSSFVGLTTKGGPERARFLKEAADQGLDVVWASSAGGANVTALVGAAPTLVEQVCPSASE